MREKSDAVADVEKNEPKKRRQTPDLVMGRVFDAPRALVFEAWSSREHFVRWFAPKGFTMPSCEADFRAGGVLRFTFRATDGSQHSFDGRYVETTQGERIVFEGRLSDGMQVHRCDVRLGWRRKDEHHRASDVLYGEPLGERRAPRLDANARQSSRPSGRDARVPLSRPPPFRPQRSLVRYVVCTAWK